MDLQSIAVNGKLLQIDPVVFATSEDGGTFFDSGTTLIHLVAEAYDSVINAVSILFFLTHFHAMHQEIFL